MNTLEELTDAFMDAFLDAESFRISESDLNDALARLAAALEGKVIARELWDYLVALHEATAPANVLDFAELHCSDCVAVTYSAVDGICGDAWSFTCCCVEHATTAGTFTELATHAHCGSGGTP